MVDVQRNAFVAWHSLPLLTSPILGEELKCVSPINYKPSPSKNKTPTAFLPLGGILIWQVDAITRHEESEYWHRNQ